MTPEALYLIKTLTKRVLDLETQNTLLRDRLDSKRMELRKIKQAAGIDSPTLCDGNYAEPFPG